MRSILVMLIAAALLAVPALAFELTSYDFSAIEDEDDAYVRDSGTYTFERVAVDTDNEFTEQNAYSALIFGAEEGVQWNGDLANTAAVVANKVNTKAYVYNEEYDPEDEESPEYVEGVRSDITRQYLQQKGSAYAILTPVDTPYDPEGQDAPEATVQVGFKKSNLAWVSGDLDRFEATPVSYAVVGGNSLDAVPEELSPICKNVWLYEQEQENPITVTAMGESRLLDAYVGSASNANLVMIPSVGDKGTSNYIPATAKMSGYAEQFGGYTNAWVDAANRGEYVDTETGELVPAEVNNIVIDFGAGQKIENYWNTGMGLLYDEPVCDDFPAEVPVYSSITGEYLGTEEWVTFPNNLPEAIEENAIYDDDGDFKGIEYP